MAMKSINGTKASAHIFTTVKSQYTFKWQWQIALCEWRYSYNYMVILVDKKFIKDALGSK